MTFWRDGVSLVSWFFNTRNILLIALLMTVWAAYWKDGEMREGHFKDYDDYDEVTQVYSIFRISTSPLILTL